MKSEGLARAILIYHVNFTMGTVFFSKASVKKEGGRGWSTVQCVSKRTYLRRFRL